MTTEHTTDTRTVTDWVDGYRRAWESNDPRDIGALFTDDATYRDHPSQVDAPAGRDAIVASWLASKDEPGDTTFAYEVAGLSGDRAFVQAVTDYVKAGDVYDNLWVIDFAPDGRANAFTEWYMKRKAD